VADQLERRAQVEVHDPVVLLHRVVLHALAHVHGGGEHERRGVAEALGGGLHLGVVEHVEAGGLGDAAAFGDRGGGGLGRVEREVGDDDARPVGGERQGGLAADAPGAHHDGGAAVEAEELGVVGGAGHAVLLSVGGRVRRVGREGSRPSGAGCGGMVSCGRRVGSSPCG
jgi:hypothetical protein